MGLLDPTPPPYDPLEWARLPFEPRGRQVCQAWAVQGYGAPIAVHAAYLLKILLFVAGWALCCARSPALGPLAEIGRWWLHPLAFQKAIVWSLLFEILGLGCGSGPLTGHYFPPLGGGLHFLRPGTTKLPLFPGAPLVGGRTRTWLDVLLYAGVLGVALSLVLGLSPAPEPDPRALLALAVLVPLCGVVDKTLFLAARAEHYWVLIVCFAATPFLPGWVAGAKAVQLALWFWAGVSKLNAHFPAVVGVMLSNSPVARFGWLRRALYRAYPDDLRPSGLAVALASAGTALELGVPLAFALTPLGVPPVAALGLMLLLHGFIASNVPLGVPLEWNVTVVYGGFALFYAHPDVALSAAPLGLAIFLGVVLGLVPLCGNLFPGRISFLLAMRYYAGNWAYSIWLFKGEAHRRLDALKKASAWVDDQLGRFYDRRTAVGLLGKVMGFRLMHLHGRALATLVPKVLEAPLADYAWVDGELIAGLALGWNFGEGHLHQEQLLEALQAQCGFLPGELRCIFVEAQPLGRGTLAYRLWDAAAGRLDGGTLSVAELRARQPWG